MLPPQATYYRIPGATLPRPTTQSSQRWRPPHRALALAGLLMIFVVYNLSQFPARDLTPRPATDLVLDDTASLLYSKPPQPTNNAADGGPPASTTPEDIVFKSRLPCNALTETIVPSTSLAHLSLPSLQRWVSPSPPLSPSTPLEARLLDWLVAPVAPYVDWLRFNKQTCGNPSTRRNANNLHARKNKNVWQNVGIEKVRKIRSELRSVLVDAERTGRFEEWKESDRKGTRGLVWTAGNADTFERSLVSLRLLRNVYNCTLPAQIFHFPSEAPSSEQATEFEELNAQVLALETLDKEEEGDRTKSFHLKGGAIVESAFDEVLLLDSDNIPARNPTFLFDSAEFREMGVVLWPDFFKDQPENAIWSILGVQCRDEFTVEAGQVLVRKSEHLDALLIVEHMLRDWRFWFQISDGDKDLFRYALLALRKRWAIPARHLSSASWTDGGALGAEHERQFAGHTMVQYGLASEGLPARPLFVHANLLKRVVSNLENGNTFGRTLQLRLPLAAADSPAPSDAPPFILSSDYLANTSPFTGVGISDPGCAAPEWVRMRAVLERGLAMHFWDGHRGAAYVLAVESGWSDELGSLALQASADMVADGLGAGEKVHPGAGLWHAEGMDREEWKEWLRWVTQERESPCTSEPANLRAALLLDSQSPDRPDGGTAAAEPEERRMEIVLWEEDDDLHNFEQQFYRVGRGTAGGYGFR